MAKQTGRIYANALPNHSFVVVVKQCDIPHLGAINSGAIQSKIALLNNLSNVDPKTHISIHDVTDIEQEEEAVASQQGRHTLNYETRHLGVS